MTLPVLLALLQQAAGTDTAQGRPCVVAVDSVRGNANQVEVERARPGVPAIHNYFAGGGVWARCKGTPSTLYADSVAWYGRPNRFDMIGHVRIRDSLLALDANLASYFVRQEMLEAHNKVVAVNRETGSVIRGPNLTYLRAAPGVRDTLEMYATSRPTIEYRERPDSGEPYLIVADRVRFKGNDRMWGRGKVTIDRSDVAARADSVALDQTAGFAVLVGRPRVEGKTGQTYTLVGTRIELALEQREVRLVQALGEGHATGDDWTLTADTIHLAIDRGKLQQAFAWGDSSRPHAVSSRHTVQADSLALDAPDEVLTEMRAFGRAFSTSKRDAAAAAADLDWIAGDTIVAGFTPVTDSAGDTRTELERLTARGAARAFTHLYENGARTGPPALNYSRGTTIAVTLKQDRIDRVIVSGPADGVHLEARPPAAADTAASSPSPPPPPASPAPRP